MLKLIFWILASVILYTYVGYPLLLLMMTLIKHLLLPNQRTGKQTEYLPEVTLLIAAFNEKDFIEQKMRNSRAIDYPDKKLTIAWVTDGSDDGTPELLEKYPEIRVLHEPERKGKTAALNRAMEYIKTPFVVFNDANTMLDSQALKRMMIHFDDRKVGCVSGEKRIVKSPADTAAGSGEGAYWKYESFIKQLESKLYTALAAAGELYAIRSKLFVKAEPDSIIDDFVISIRIALAGYTIKYAPDAFALETPSLNINEELKRKIRIASGGFQTLFRYPGLLNIFRHGLLSFEFISHKVLRWLLVPLAIPSILMLNIWICLFSHWNEPSFMVLLLVQAAFYTLVLLGWFVERSPVKYRFIYLPYYIIIMNYAQIAGLVRYLRRKHNVVWEKARRAV
jgi:cellulose synthase/poly-beta-1,6-N-acetylglucosamine synthase-like glycosyltransferase